ncbi:MAG: queuosine precursor transporter, partial [Candidatus Thorarchaeota archaeon]
IVQLGNVAIPAGTFIFALTFTWRDALHRRLGREWARAAIMVAGAANVTMALYFAFAISLPAASFWPNQEAFASVLGVVPRITVASIVAEVASEWIDTEVYHQLRGLPRWVGVLGSNAVSLPIDSLIFVGLAFGGTTPLAVMFTVVWGQTLLKAVMTLLSLPVIYLVKQGPTLLGAEEDLQAVLD